MKLALSPRAGVVVRGRVVEEDKVAIDGVEVEVEEVVPGKCSSVIHGGCILGISSSHSEIQNQGNESKRK